MCNAYCFCTVTMGARTCLIVTFIRILLPCFNNPHSCNTVHTAVSYCVVWTIPPHNLFSAFSLTSWHRPVYQTMVLEYYGRHSRTNAKYIGPRGSVDGRGYKFCYQHWILHFVYFWYFCTDVTQKYMDIRIIHVCTWCRNVMYILINSHEIQHVFLCKY
jgi:hypothetical protein